MEEMDLYGFTLKAADGSAFPLATARGRPLLVVNTASRCGFTGQYAGLEELHRTYGKRGLVVLGFPCDQFAHQEPGNEAEILSFCRLTYDVTFPMMAKVEVNGSGAHPLFVELRKRTRGMLGDAVAWNFTKFLVAPDGIRVKRYAPSVEPAKLAVDIEEMLTAMRAAPGAGGSAGRSPDS